MSGAYTRTVGYGIKKFGFAQIWVPHRDQHRTKEPGGFVRTDRTRGLRIGRVGLCASPRIHGLLVRICGSRFDRASLFVKAI